MDVYRYLNDEAGLSILKTTSSEDRVNAKLILYKMFYIFTRCNKLELIIHSNLLITSSKENQIIHCTGIADILALSCNIFSLQTVHKNNSPL